VSENKDLKTPELLVKKLSEPMVRGWTVAEMVSWCFDRGLDPSEVQSTGGHLCYERLETEDERDKRMTWWKDQEARHERWERETLVRLTEKYGTP
jgi:hypothetical protein